MKCYHRTCQQLNSVFQNNFSVPNRDKVAMLSRAQVRSIAERKMDDLNANDVDMAMRIIAGTARSMGVEVEA